MDLPSTLKREISSLVAGFIREQNSRYAPRAAALDDRSRKIVAPFFRGELLAAVRVLVLTGEQVPNPAIYEKLRALGLRDLPDFSEMAAITFDEVVVSHQPFTSRLLFHELVHAEQYRQLGIDRFADLYVHGFLDGGGYDGIPLEIQAYELDARFAQAPNLPFNVEREVSAWIHEGRFEVAH